MVDFLEAVKASVNAAVRMEPCKWQPVKANKGTDLCNVHDLNGGKLTSLRVPTLKQKHSM
jgi:hypothetical protein